MDDLISRQAAINETWKEPSYTDPYNVLTEVRGRIQSLPPAQQWTPCSEGLPKKGSYLVTGRKSRDWYESDRIVTVAFYDGEFWTHNGDIQVEAWMPRPKPYKGEEE